jgi:23S rRNA pseudouridine2605 synthase
MKIRLNKFIADSGISSRRKADELICDGKVSVNGQIVTTLGIKVDPILDKVTVEGKELRRADNFVYYAIYKPKGIVSTVHDEKGRQSVVDLVPAIPRVYPVGRLDVDSEGLMILTNDGELTQKLTHPSFKHQKEYVAEARIANTRIWNKFKDNVEQVLKKGLFIDNKIVSADSAHIIKLSNDKSIVLNIILHTGYNRQIRRMCAKIGLNVQKLTRIKIEKLTLGELDLNPGEFKNINKSQIL